ncbi:acyl-CoA dehydrogenase family protein [Thermopolyspora sp. NPDC052614]|uniref:acyl-CoA dehydrogenase family protein n=1 Tax=Thermopolyspora sp. NPDC052614 TaxID=3155682 RepID=UPI00343BA21B
MNAPTEGASPERSASLLYGEIEEELRAAVRDLLADACAPADVLARVEDGPSVDTGLWKTLARDIGVAGLLVPEEAGGAGASSREAAVVLEELGRAVAPVPFLTSSVLATVALLGSDAAEAGELLGAVASGEVTAAVAVPLAASPYRGVPESVEAGPGGALTGRVTGVAGADAADVLLVPAAGAVHAVDRAAVAVEPVTSLDLTRRVATVALSSAPARVVADAQAVRRALLAGAGLLASEQLGVAEWCLTTTLSYVKERHQFARPIGSFQAIKHRLADLWLAVVQARAAARAAADALAGGVLWSDGASEESRVEVETTIAVAAAWCGDVAVQAAEECIQLHGGIGMTWEHPAHLYLKRAKADQIALGTPGDHRAALATLADLPAPA